MHVPADDPDLVASGEGRAEPSQAAGEPGPGPAAPEAQPDQAHSSSDEMQVIFEIPDLVDNGGIENAKVLQVIGLDTDRPILKLDAWILAGKWEPIIGSMLGFHNPSLQSSFAYPGYSGPIQRRIVFHIVQVKERPQEKMRE